MATNNNFCILLFIAILLLLLLNLHNVNCTDKTEENFINENAYENNKLHPIVEDIECNKLHPILEDTQNSQTTQTPTKEALSNKLSKKLDDNIQGYNKLDKESNINMYDYNDVNKNDVKYTNGVVAKEALQSKDLLPGTVTKNQNSFQSFVLSPDEYMNALDIELPDYKLGIDTVGQSRKNASYDIREAPINPKFNIGPWNNSTIEVDGNIRSFC